MQTLLSRSQKPVVSDALFYFLYHSCFPFVSAFLHIQSNILFILVYILSLQFLFNHYCRSAFRDIRNFMVSLFGAGSVLLKLVVSILCGALGVYGAILAMVGLAMVMYLFIFSASVYFQSKHSPLPSAREAFGMQFRHFWLFLAWHPLFNRT